jgi:hypothetical protein
MSNALLPMDTRRQLLRALKTRYQAASKAEKTRILEEFILISGYHRKSAIRLLNGAVTNGNQQSRSATARSIYGAAVQQALIVLWEASDRLCGKRLRALLPQLIPAMEKHGHLSLNPTLREQLMKISASSIDRLLKEAHTTAGKKRNRVVNRVSKNIPVRMFTEHERHSPGFMGDGPRGTLWPASLWYLFVDVVADRYPPAGGQNVWRCPHARRMDHPGS